MKRPIGVLFVLFILALPGFSQVSYRLVVSDAVSRNGIPYATIKVVNKPDGTYADETGRFEVKTLAKDSLLLTCVGYQSKTVLPQQDTIFLDPVLVNLDEIKVRSKKPKKHSVGLVDTKRDGVLYYCGHVDIENAVLLKIPPTFSYYRINGVKFNTKHESGIALVRLHIYSQGKDGMPDRELLPEDLLLNKKCKIQWIG